MSRLPIVGRTGTLRWRMLATVLAAQSVLIFFGALVARGLAVADGRAGDGRQLLWVGSGIAVLALLGAGLMRGPLGVTVGWAVQLLTWASAFVVPMMIGVGLVFSALWLWCMVAGDRVDRQMAERAAAAP